MIKVYYTDISTCRASENIQAILNTLPEALQGRIRSKKNKSLQSLWGIVLLREALKEHNEEKQIESLTYLPNQKPTIQSSYIIDFNISHSADFIVCATVMVGKVGIDIEKKRELDTVSLTGLLSEKEVKKLSKVANKSRAFLKLWVQKESVSKADGQGLQIPLNKIIIDNNTAIITENHTHWYLKKIRLSKEYIVYVASDKNESYTLKEIKLGHKPNKIIQI